MVVLTTAGCDEEPLHFPPAQAGVIHGRIHDGGELDPDTITIHAESPVDMVPRVHVQAHPDDDGRFLLVVPEGPVNIRVYGPNRRDVYWRHDGPTPYWQDAELINVAGGVRDIDFACGRARARIALPPEIASGSWEASLVCVDDVARSVARHSHLGGNPLDVTFSFIPPGRYFLLVRSPQQSAVFTPATYDTAAAEVLTVREDEEVQHDSAITGVATLSGSVTGSWQALGFDRPTVSASFGDLQVASTTTDDAGAFSVPFLAGGAFRLRVSIGGVGRWIGGDGFDTATIFALEPGQDVVGISYVESGLECVFDPAGPLPDMRYDVILRTSTRVFYNNSRDGTVLRFANLVPGDIYLKIAGWGMRDVWLPQHWDRRASPEEADPITIPPGGGVANVTVTLVQGARVFGRLLDVQGQPLSPGEMFLMVYATHDSVNVVNLYTDWDFQVALYNRGNGDYVLTQLRDGQYKMRAHAGDNPWIWWPGRAAWDSAGVFTIENAADLTGIDWRLPY